MRSGTEANVAETSQFTLLDSCDREDSAVPRTMRNFDGKSCHVLQERPQ